MLGEGIGEGEAYGGWRGGKRDVVEAEVRPIRFTADEAEGVERAN